MKEMDIAASIRQIILRLNNERSGVKPTVHLSIPATVSEFPWHGSNLETLIERFLDHVLMFSHPTGSVRVSVREEASMADLEKFFPNSPSYWLRLSVQSQATMGFEKGAREILEDLGYRCAEWMKVEGSDSQLGAFCYGPQGKLALVLFIQNHRARRICDFLIPVTESVPSFARASCAQDLRGARMAGEVAPTSLPGIAH